MDKPKPPMNVIHRRQCGAEQGLPVRADWAVRQRRDLFESDSHEMVESAMERLQESGARTLPVTRAGQMIGRITSEHITECLMIRSALQSIHGAPTA